MIKKQFTLYLENRPGMLASVTKALAAAKINIEGISVAETTDVGLVQVVVNNAPAAGKVLKRAGVPFTVQDVAVLTLPNRIGALADVAAKLAKAGININYLYCTTPDEHRAEPCVVVSGDNLARIEKLWKR
jgi:hypothetical protein